MSFSGFSVRSGVILAVLAALPAGSAALIPGATLEAAAAPQATVVLQLPPVPANGEMGFVLNEFVPAVHQGKEDCPDGLAGTVRENFLQSLPSLERARLVLKENEPELTERWKASVKGPDNTNICANPEAFSRPLGRTVQGKISAGFDLDKGQPACAHAEFTSPAGVPGIDNQAYRALGCSRNWRGVDGLRGDISGFNNFLATGEQSMVVLIRGIDSFRDDPRVEVIFASTNDRPVLDSKRNFISGTSFTVASARWRNVLTGSIHDGVLTAGPVNMILNRRLGHGGYRGQHSEYDLRQARIELRIAPDGTMRGLLGAYQTPRNMIASTLLGGIGAATVAGIDCATEYQTLVHLADGLKDPRTGQCTGVSAAYDVAGVPAFVNDLPAAGQVAAQ